MHTSVRADAEFRAAPGFGTRLKGLILYVLCGSLAFYPLLEKFLPPVIAGAYLLAGLAVALRLVANGLRIPRSPIGGIWLTYTAVYLVWFAIAVLRGNPLPYINQDSFGFLLYFVALPILFLYIRFNKLEPLFFRFITDACTCVAIISIAAVAAYYAVFGETNGESLLVTNAFLAGIGLNWQIDDNSGVLGLYTNTGHLLLLGNALVLHRYSLLRRRADLVLVSLFLVAILFDGHRALVIAGLMQLLILAPRMLGKISAARTVGLAAVAIVALAVIALPSMDWIQQRFDFSANDPSTLERHAQIPALLDKIAENPVIGGGFGTVADYVRSLERPFSYEVDFLATAMKLGLVGTLIYFGTYFFALAQGLRYSGRLGFFLFSAGLPFFFYMGTNGNQAMSTDSAVFHIFLFLLIAFTATNRAKPRSKPVETPARAE